MATTENEIPACVTHVARLESGILTGTWDREEFERYRDAERVNAQQYRPLAPEPLLASLFQGPAPEPFELAVRMRDVSVRYGDTQVLDKINWTVKHGERWVLSGPNGAGKSTLLSLINADNPQAYRSEERLNSSN